jgi:hypothetical protein
MPSGARKSPIPSRTRKAKKTFSLSRESVAFLETEKQKRGRESTSLVLEELIQECREKGNTKKPDVAITSYYDSLTDEERGENSRWGEFAESQFPSD